MTRRTLTEDVAAAAVPRESVSAEGEPARCSLMHRAELPPQPCRLANPRKRRLILARIDALLEARRQTRIDGVITRH